MRYDASEVINLLLNGKAIRKYGWWAEHYIYLRNDGLIINQNGEPQHISWSKDKVWEIYKPLKVPNVKTLYKYAYCDDSYWKETVNYFESEVDFKKNYPLVTDFKCLDYSKIEVES